MAWDIAAYAIALSALIVAVAAAYGIVRAVRALGRAERTLHRVGDETETTLRHARLLAAEATEIARAGRQAVDGVAAFAEGARALGEAAQAAGQAATQAAAFWRDRLLFRRPAEQEQDEGDERAEGAPDLIRRILNALRR